MSRVHYRAAATEHDDVINRRPVTVERYSLYVRNVHNGRNGRNGPHCLKLRQRRQKEVLRMLHIIIIYNHQYLEKCLFKPKSQKARLRLIVSSSFSNSTSTRRQDVTETLFKSKSFVTNQCRETNCYKSSL